MVFALDVNDVERDMGIHNQRCTQTGVYVQLFGIFRNLVLKEDNILGLVIKDEAFEIPGVFRLELFDQRAIQAIFDNAQTETCFVQLGIDHALQGFLITAVNIVSQAVEEFLNHRLGEGRCFFFRGGFGGHPDINLTGMG